jgi:hypothetical protein
LTNRNRPTQADIKIIDLFNGIEPNSLFNHVLRWFKHLNSFNFNERKSFPQSFKNLNSFYTHTKNDYNDDYENFDLFGSDEEKGKILISLKVF